MKQILLFGAGKSATSLIRYLIQLTAARDWRLVVADSQLSLIESKIGGALQVQALALRVEEADEREAAVRQADIVISLLPPAYHHGVALSCLKYRVHLLTASYLDPAIQALGEDIRNSGLLFLGEMGLDPGIDHMSAMQMIERIRTGGGRIFSFLSHTGGLVAPASDNNPWHYKISWNPRNVVLAGAAGARFRQNGQVLTLDYPNLFEQGGEVRLGGLAPLAWYANRDSLSYIPLYGLEDTDTFIRTTLRYPAFLRAWAAIARAGLTDDQSPLPPEAKTLRDWSAPLLPFVNEGNQDQLVFLGLFEETPLPPAARSSADLLQYLLETRLAMNPSDKDMIIMQHAIGYEKEGKRYLEKSTLIVEGKDHLDTAMARTVGLPLGIAARLILEGDLSLRGLFIPIHPEIYIPVLHELEEQGIRFSNRVSLIDFDA